MTSGLCWDMYKRFPVLFLTKSDYSGTKMFEYQTIFQTSQIFQLIFWENWWLARLYHLFIHAPFARFVVQQFEINAKYFCRRWKQLLFETFRYGLIEIICFL